MEISEILKRFKVDRQLSNNSWQGFCPAHDDTNPSLTITKGHRGVLLKCHSGCDYRDILDKVGLRTKDLFQDQRVGIRTIEAVYPYGDKDGRLLYEVVRYKPKSFSIRRKDERGNVLWGLAGQQPVLYRLKQVVDAVSVNEPVYIVEGEKDADSIANMGLVATTSPMGAGKWRDSYSDCLIGACVVIIPDNDGPGRQHAFAIIRSLRSKAARIKLVTLPDGSKDVTEWLQSGGDRPKLEEMVSALTEVDMSAEASNTDILEMTNLGSALVFDLKSQGIRIELSKIRETQDCRIKALMQVTDAGEHGKCLYRDAYNLTSSQEAAALAVKLSAHYPHLDWLDILGHISDKAIAIMRPFADISTIWSDQPYMPQTYKLEPIVVENEINVLFGDGGTGKSYLALLFAIVMTLPWRDNPLGLNPKMAKVLYLDWESGDQNRISHRLKKLLTGHGLPDMAIDYARCMMPLADEQDHLIKYIRKNSIDLIIVDSLAPACGGDPNAAETAIRFYQALRQLGCTSLVIAHQSKTDEGKKSIYGSVFFRNLARSVWHVKSNQEAGDNILCISLAHNKENDGGKKPDIGFKMTFDVDAVNVERVEYGATAKPPKRSAIDDIMDAIEAGYNTTKSIAELTGIKQDTVYKTLSRKEGEAVKREGDSWILL